MKKFLVIAGTFFLIWFLFFADLRSHDGFSNTWGSNECPPIPPCQACPCPMAKLCPSCNNGFPGYTKYGPSSIAYKAQPGTYTCAGTKQQGYCVVDTNDALNVCNSDPKCAGFLQFNETDTTRMLISGTPSNYGNPTNTVYYEKTGGRPPSGSNNLQNIAFALDGSGTKVYAILSGQNGFPGIEKSMNVRITIDQILSTVSPALQSEIAAMNNQTYNVQFIQPSGSVVALVTINPSNPAVGQQAAVLGDVSKV